MSRFRSSTGNLAFGEDEPNRWDREKFDRLSRRAPYEDEYRLAERDRVGPRGGVRDVAVEERIDRPGPRGSRFEERDRYFEEDRYGPPRRARTDFMEEPTPSEVASRALAPFRRRSIVERDVEVPVRRPRPQFIRRQSSLDTFDRRPMPRYGDEYRIPPEVPVPLPIRRPRSPPRRYREEAFEEVRYKDLPAEYDEYRDIRVRRERRGRRSQSRAPTSVRSSSSSSSSFEEVEVPAPPKIGKRGKTRMPKRLAHKKAVIELGYPFEEEEDFIIVQRALGKEHIDEIIEKSKTYREEKIIYKYETESVKDEPRLEALPPPPLPPPPPTFHHPGETVVKTTTTILEGAPPPPPMSFRSPSPARSVASHKTHNTHHSHHAHHPPHHAREELVEERIVEESNHIGGPLTLVHAPDRGYHNDQEILREIKALEAERRALKLEREAALIRDTRDTSDYEVIERVERVDRPRERSVVRVEKDRKGRLALVRSAH